MMKTILQQGLTEWGMDQNIIPSLETFSHMLLEKNQVMNLTAITEPAAVATLHLLDSLSLLRVAELSGKSLIDVGTGAGFPGMPIGISQKDIRLTLLDSLQKRVDFLQEVCDALQLNQITCVHARAEEFAQQHRESYDFATSRAVAALPVLCELCLPLVKVGGQFLAMKATDSEEEINSAKAAITLLGGKIRQVVDYTIPTTDVTHRIICIEKVAPTPKKYPRRFAQIKKQPLG